MPGVTPDTELQQLTVQHREDVTRTGLSARWGQHCHISFVCSLPSFIAKCLTQPFSVPSSQLNRWQDEGTGWQPSQGRRCPSHRLVLEPSAGLWHWVLLRLWCSLEETMWEAVSNWYMLQREHETISSAVNNPVVHNIAYNPLYLGHAHALHVCSPWWRSSEVDGQGWLHLPSLFYRFLTLFSVQSCKQVLSTCFVLLLG